MALRVLTAEDRRSAAHNKTSLLIAGPYGVGKTSLLRTLPGARTLIIDIEGGLKSVDTWSGAGSSIPVANWRDFQDLTVLIAGPDSSLPPQKFLSEQHYEHALKTYAGTIVEEYARLPIVFVDSITVLTRLAFIYAQQQPEAFSEKTGKPDTRGAYGLLAREVIGTLSHLQRASGKTVIFSAILAHVKDDFGQWEWVIQLEGSKAGRELPGIVDQVVTMHTFRRDEEGNYALDDKAEERRFVCTRGNPYGVPAKDRSRNLSVTEAPDLGALLTKINHVE